MTKPRQSSPSSTKPRYKHHRKIPREDPYIDDYSDHASLSQPLYQSNQDDDDDEQEYDRPIKDEDDDDDVASYMGSKSETNEPSDPFSPRSNQFASYMNIAPLPIFRGAPNECPVTHLSRFAKVCRANNASAIDMMIRIFPVTLEDEAALWYDLNIEPYKDSLNWEDIKSSFSHAYQKIELVDRLRSDLMMINQGEEESVRSYFLRLQWILKQWPDHGLADGLLKGVFVDGLREDFRDRIVSHKPESLNEALRVAFEFEQVKSIRPVRKGALKCGFCDGGHEERGCEVRERMRELWRKSKEDEEAEEEAALVRSVSIGGGKSGGGDDGKEEEEGGFMGGKKKSQCQCWKHQCGKKKLERNNSFVTGNSKPET